MSNVQSSPLTIPLSSVGEPKQFPIPWSSFVQIVLEITVEAHQNMRRDKIAQRGWEEDIFTALLVTKYIRPIVRKHPLSLVVEPQTPVYSEAMTEAMKSGQISPKEAPQIDIKVIMPRWDYNEVYFAWECKLVGDKRSNREYARLISEYVTEGIFRFIDGKYSSEVDDAGMLGYVLEGDVSNIVSDINESMLSSKRRRQLAASDHLIPDTPLNINDTYRSQHHRKKDSSKIRLKHLFLTFDFV